MGHDSPVSEGERITEGSDVGSLQGAGPTAAPDQDVPLEIEFPLESPSAYRLSVEHEIARARSLTENHFLKVAIWSVSLSPLIVFGAFYWLPTAQTAINDVFERWLTVLGPLVGAAFGFGIAKKGGQ